jgi:NADP-dependent 3-hydroxy acid dehydrogenase YdfG
MKVAITGTSRGLGKVLHDTLCAKWIPVQFNRPEYDISTSEGINKIINKLKSDNSYSVFVNNAHSHFDQTKLLLAVFYLWKNDPKKLIININSRSKYPNLSKGFMYSASKASLSHLSDSLKFTTDKKCRIMDVNLGLFDSDLPSLTSREIVDIIIWAINKPPHIEIGEISAWHSECYVEVQKQKEKQLNQIKLNESRKNMGQD